jgi:hypothetical protein
MAPSGDMMSNSNYLILAGLVAASLALKMAYDLFMTVKKWRAKRPSKEDILIDQKDAT